MNRIIGGLVLSLACASAYATSYSWSGSSGLFPDEVNPPFTLVDSASPEVPTLAGGVMTLSTSTASENMYYIISGGALDLPSPLKIDFRMRYVSGTTQQSDRLSVQIPFTIASTVGNVFNIGADRAFLLLGTGDISKSGFDTDDAFHDWSIVVSGVAIGSDISVYYDGGLLMAGKTVANPVTLGSTPRVAFGDFSVRAFGVSEWQSFSVGTVLPAVPEPAAWMLLAAGVLALGSLRRRQDGVVCR